MDNEQYQYKPIKRDTAKSVFFGDFPNCDLIYGKPELKLQKKYGLTSKQIVELKKRFLKFKNV